LINLYNKAQLVNRNLFANYVNALLILNITKKTLENVLALTGEFTQRGS